MIKACFINNNYVEPDKAFIKINDLGLLRGFAIFDYCGANNFKPFMLDAYISRFIDSANILGLNLSYSDIELRNIALTLGEKTHLEKYGIRFLLTGGYTEDGFSISKSNLIILTEEVKPSTNSEEETGVKLMSYIHQRELAEVKTTNYITAIKLQPQKIAQNAYDILYHNNGKILELTRSNFFLVKDGKVITPYKNILKGITRKIVMDLSENNFELEERDIYLDELAEADEAFLTSTGKKIISIKQVDEIEIGKDRPGKITAELIKLFQEFEYTETRL